MAHHHPATDDPAIAEGHFARKQLFSRSRLISWSHGRRFQIGLRLVGDLRGRHVLDFGCGDATFLALLMRSDQPPAAATGAELDPNVIADNRRRFGQVPNVRFVFQSELDAPEFAGAFDDVVCMEVCEHLVNPAAVLDAFVRLLAPGGRLLLSIPVETGLPLLVKQTVRRIAGWRNIGDYKHTTPYTWLELARGVVAGSTQHMARPLNHLHNGQPFHDHKGFNWRVLRQLVADRFEITHLMASPLTWLPLGLGSQVWITARKRG